MTWKEKINIEAKSLFRWERYDTDAGWDLDRNRESLFDIIVLRKTKNISKDTIKYFIKINRIREERMSMLGL